MPKKHRRMLPSSRAASPRIGKATAAIVGLASFLVLVERPARADVYEDAREVIEQLIQDNIAQEVIPNAARRSQAVCDFFPATVHAIEMKRYEGLRKVVRKEVSDAIGLVALKEVTVALGGRAETLSGASTVDALQGAVEGRKVALMPRAPEAGVCGKAYDHASPGAMFEALESKATVALRKCASRQVQLDDELACAAAILVRDAADGDDRLLTTSVRRLAAAMTVKLVRSKLTVTSPDAGDAALTLASAALAAGLGSSLSDETLASELCVSLGGTVQPPAPAAVVDQSPLPAPPLQASPTCTANAKARLSLIRDAKVDSATLDRALAQVANSTDDPVVCPTPSVCKSVHDLATGTQGAVRYVEAKNYGAAAGATFDVAKQLNCANKSAPGCSDDDKLVYGFLRALAIYSVDSLSSGATTSSSAGFRQAAVDLIEANSGLGIHRSLSYREGWLYIPEFSIRAAYQPPYLDETSPRSIVYPSIDLVRARIPVSYWAAWRHLFVAGQFSAIDGLGPFTELATRDRSLGSGNASAGVPVLALITPRFDIEIGFPDITRHLVVGGGLAIRLYHAEGTAGAARYCTIFGSGECDHVTTENVEFSLFAKYVP